MEVLNPRIVRNSEIFHLLHQLLNSLKKVTKISKIISALLENDFQKIQIS